MMGEKSIVYVMSSDIIPDGPLSGFQEPSVKDVDCKDGMYGVRTSSSESLLYYPLILLAKEKRGKMKNKIGVLSIH